MNEGVRTALVVVAVGGLGTFLLRFSFMAAAGRMRSLPPRVETGLKMIPPAALAALVAPALLRPDGPIAPLGPEAIAGAAALLIMWRTRNVLLTLGVGMAVVIALTSLG